MRGVGLNRAKLLLAQLARLVEDPVGDRELADVVQQRGAAHDPPLVGVEAEHGGDAVGDLGHALGVAGGERRLGVDHAGERLGDAVQTGVVGRDRDLRRLPARDVGSVELRPRSRGRRRSPGRRRPARGRTSGRAGAWPPRVRPSRHPLAWNASTVCARHAIRAASGISSPRSPSGMPRPSQCSSRLRIAAAVGSERNSMRAISAPRSQRASMKLRVTVALVANAAQHLDAPAQARRRAPPYAATTATPRGGWSSRSSFERRLGAAVVGREQRRHAVGVGRAAGVLEQQRVEQIGALGRVQVELRGQAHPDQAGADRVTRRLSLGDVERVRKRADDPG